MSRTELRFENESLVVFETYNNFWLCTVTVSDLKWGQVGFRSREWYQKSYLFSFSMSGLDNMPDEKEASKDAEPEGLKILTTANFETFLSQTEHVIVMFYAPCK